VKKLAIPLALVALVAVLAGPVHAGGKTRTTSSTSDIWIASVDGMLVARTAQPAPAFGDKVNFGTAVQPLAGWQYPLVAIYCYQDVDGNGLETVPASADLVYAQLDKPDTTFVMGGGSSEWLESGGGDATCDAVLYAYPGFHKGDIVTLDDTGFWNAAG